MRPPITLVCNNGTRIRRTQGIAPSAQAIGSAAGLLTFLNDRDGFAAALPIDVDLVASALGITVVESEEGGGGGEVSAIALAATHAIIRIHRGQLRWGPSRRWAVAHAIAHFCLHLSPSRPSWSETHRSLSVEKSFWNVEESAANDFAGKLLMPDQAVFAQAWRITNAYKASHGCTLVPEDECTELLARRFDVPFKIMQARLRQMGIRARH